MLWSAALRLEPIQTAEARTLIGGTGPYQECGPTPLTCPAACVSLTCAVGSSGCVQTGGGSNGCTGSIFSYFVCQWTLYSYWCTDGTNPTACGTGQAPSPCVTTYDNQGFPQCQALSPGCAASGAVSCAGC